MRSLFLQKKKGLASIFHASRSSPSFFFVSKNKNKTSKVVFSPSANAPRMKKKKKEGRRFTPYGATEVLCQNIKVKEANKKITTTNLFFSLSQCLFYLYTIMFTSSLRRSIVIRLQLSVEKAMAINATEITAAIVANDSV